MTKHDKGKVSLVEFLRSIKFTHDQNQAAQDECPTHFANFEQRARTRRQFSAEDKQVIRSAN